MCRLLGDPHVITQLLGTPHKLVKEKWRHFESWAFGKGTFSVHFRSHFASSQYCSMHVTDSLWVFWHRDACIASCSSSRDHLELAVCSSDSCLPLSPQPVTRRASTCLTGLLRRGLSTRARRPPLPREPRLSVTGQIKSLGRLLGDGL